MLEGTFHELGESLENLNLRLLDFIIHVCLQNLKNKTRFFGFLSVDMAYYILPACVLLLVYHSSRKKAGGRHKVHIPLITTFRLILKKANMRNQISDFFRQDLSSRFSGLLFPDLQGT